MAGIGLGLDYTGGSIANLSPNDLGKIGLIAFGVFLILTLLREIDLSLEPRPRVVYEGLSLASAPVRFFTLGKPLEEKMGTSLDCHSKTTQKLRLARNLLRNI